MQSNDYNYCKTNFFTNENIKDFKKTFFINANDEIFLEPIDKTSVLTGIYFKLMFKKVNKNLLINIKLFCWSNNKQRNVILEESIWNNEDFGAGKYIDKIHNHYKNIITNFFNSFKNIKYYWKYKNIFYHLENPPFIFHYKLLNVFSQEILTDICKKHFPKYPTLNISILKNSSIKNLEYLFLPLYFNGFYINGIEISVDLNESDYAVMEDGKGVISKEEFLKRIG